MCRYLMTNDLIYRMNTLYKSSQPLLREPQVLPEPEGTINATEKSNFRLKVSIFFKVGGQLQKQPQIILMVLSLSVL